MALMFSNSAPVGCKVVGRYDLESVSARYRFVPRSYYTSITFLKSHYHTLKVFWRARYRLLQDGFQRLVVALDFHVASVGVLVKFLK